MCWACNAMLANFPYDLFLAQIVAIYDNYFVRRRMDPGDGSQFMSKGRKQRKPVRITYPRYGGLAISFPSMVTANLMQLQVEDHSLVEDITPSEFRQDVSDKVFVNRIRLALGCALDTSEAFDHTKYIQCEQLLKIEKELMLKAAAAVVKSKPRRSIGEPLFDVQDESLYNFVSVHRSGNLEPVWNCFFMFDKDDHPTLQDRVKCKHCVAVFPLKSIDSHPQLHEAAISHAREAHNIVRAYTERAKGTCNRPLEVTHYQPGHTMVEITGTRLKAWGCYEAWDEEAHPDLTCYVKCKHCDDIEYDMGRCSASSGGRFRMTDTMKRHALEIHGIKEAK